MSKMEIRDVPESWENTAGLNGIEFVEYASPDPAALGKLFESFGFKKVAKHKSKNVTLYRQGDVNFILNEEPETFAAKFAKEHGPSICAMGLRVESTEHAMKWTLDKGARDLGIENDQKSHSFPGIYGIGDSAVYFIDRYKNLDNYKEDFDFFEEPDWEGYKVMRVDHLTNNVPQNEMQKWCDFYQDLFNFKEVRYFEIEGKETGLVSKVMMSPCKKIIIPINEPTGQKSQIQEYIDEYKGSGIQHLALLTPDIEFSVSQFRENGINFLDVPDTYYDMVPDRLPNVEEDVSSLQNLRILADGDPEGYLLQIFSKNIIGPIFFEIIQRKGHDGFGEGNFQALFDAIERDQKQRGYL